VGFTGFFASKLASCVAFFAKPPKGRSCENDVLTNTNKITLTNPTTEIKANYFILLTLLNRNHKSAINIAM